ncbi:succinate dehydrogenase/fumarate reductase flavoprotein subunit, partial [Endobacter medicaginis]
QRISRPGRVSGRDWRARSGAVVLATGGCAWLSGLIGSATNTGDGYLMAAEAGARLSGMEFSVSYSVSPAWHSTRVLLFAFARYFDAHGRELNLPPMLSGGDFIGALAAELARGPVLAQLDRMPPEVRAAVPQVQPASLLPFRRRGIDPFNDRFEVALFGEGTIRGTGGLRIADAACRTD